MEKYIGRRQFLKKAAAGVVGVPYFVSSSALGLGGKVPASERIVVGCIGVGARGSSMMRSFMSYDDVQIVAVCDVDRHVRDQAKASFGSTPRAFEDYQELLQRKEVDVVTIGSPDHWHTKMVIDACRAGKDVYCEKPLTLTIDEGKQLRKVVKETGRIVQVGSWQRSDHRFRQAVEMVRQGRIGKLSRVGVVLGKNQTGGPFESRKVPLNLNWDLWQGQTPNVPYLQERSHYTFRWWKEYSGGQMTDWGAHHLDIAQWAINSLPVEIQGVAKWPNSDGGYNVPNDFNVTYQYENGVTMTVADEGRNGILFTGDAGRIFVNRGSLSGKPVDELSSKPLERQDWQVYDFDNLERPERAGKLDAIISHMGNFFDCVKAGKTPISDIESQHRSVSTCHLGNIALQLGRALKWNPANETFIDDAQANAHLSREQREGFETS